MLSQAKVNEVKRLLADGWPDRKVAMRTGVSRGAISRIRSGEWDQRREKRGRGPDQDEPADFAEVRRRADEALQEKLARKRAQLAST